jgi:hypothetical protein
MCVILLYSLSVLDAPYLGRQPKQSSKKENKSPNIRGHTSAVGHLRGSICSSVTDEYMCHLLVPGPGPHPSTFVGDMSPMNTIRYIRRFHVTDKYIVTFIGTYEQVDLNLLELRSSIDSSVNRWIYSMFVYLEDKFVDRRINLCFCSGYSLSRSVAGTSAQGSWQPGLLLPSHVVPFIPCIVVLLDFPVRRQAASPRHQVSSSKF